MIGAMESRARIEDPTQAAWSDGPDRSVVVAYGEPPPHGRLKLK